MSSLARLYGAGEGVEEDAEMARQIYQLAIEKGSPVAELNLGLLYYTKQLIDYFKLAKEHGELDAVEQLKKIFRLRIQEEGLCT